ncbi:hypothetical protein [Ensifer canadensis]|uniref:hypothetical protein n=1 Tax=Ensifer canadensis TaxID=555315 RepID=UPI0035E3CB1A
MLVIADIFAAVAAIVASFALAVVRYGASVTRNSLQGLGIAACWLGSVVCPTSAVELPGWRLGIVRSP